MLILSNKTTPALALVFGFCTILRMMLPLADSYMNLYLPMNSPEKLWLSTAVVAAIFFLVCEIRALVTKPYTATWFFSAATAVSVLWPSSLILILGSRDGVFYQPISMATLLFAVFLFTVALYAIIRLFTMAINPLPKEDAELPEETEPTEETIETIETIIYNI